LIDLNNFYWEAKNDQLPVLCCFHVGAWDHPSGIVCKLECYLNKKKNAEKRQPSFAKLPYRNNTADTTRTSRGATEQCNQGWIRSDDTRAESSELAVAPVTTADSYPGTVSGKGALSLNLTRFSVLESLRKRSQPIWLGVFLLII